MTVQVKSSISVKAHNILKSLSVLLIAIGGLTEVTYRSLPYTDYIGIAVAFSGVAGYWLANYAVNKNAALPSAEAIIAAAAKTYTAVKTEVVTNPPAPIKTILQQLIDNPVDTIAEAEAIFNQATANYKVAVANAATQTPTTS
jgi:hypothetical protein